MSNLRSKPEIKPFSHESFFKLLESSPPLLSVALKGPVAELYRKFLKSANFGSWLQIRTGQVNREWRIAYLNVICTQNMEEWAREKLLSHRDVEVMDLLLRIQDELVCSFKH